MKSNFEKLGDHIREVNVRNKDLSVSNLVGINIDKYYMPSVANIVGTDLSTYKIVEKGQFACNRMHVGRDYRLPVALSKEEKSFIVSPAYDVFEIIDEDVLLPEYLMMWFRRKEFDRNAWFYTDADVRGGLPWKSFCEMGIPVPDIEKQKEIVKEYNTIVNRIELNNRLIQKLEETAQAIYKQWFVDFEFPDEEGKPYKSNGGEVFWNEKMEQENPIEWRNGTLKDLYKFQYGIGNINPNNGGQYPIYGAGGVIGGFNEYNSEDAPVIGHMGEYCGKVIFVFGKHFVTYNGVKCLAKNENSKYFSYMTLLSKDLMSNTRGSSQPFVSYDMLYEIQTILPKEEIALKFDELVKVIFVQINSYQLENQKLTELIELLLLKLATIEK